jgi:hypothetical protein
LGRNRISFSTGLQFTLRRDTKSAVELNQNLFRQFAYFSTNSLFNWLAIRGDVAHEAGPFSLRHLNSRDLSSHLEFRVGRPWGRTAFITGYGVRDLQFNPLVREYFTTSSYIGLEHKFGTKLKIAGRGEFIRSWRVEDQNSAHAEAFRPGIEVEYRRDNRWNLESSFAITRGPGFHQYDNFESGFLLSYLRPWRAGLGSSLAESPVDYPLRFSVGVRTQSFYNFGGNSRTTTIVPVFRITLF